jgi:hypothetical protein
MDATKRKFMRGRRYSLFALMFVMTCVCGYLGGYRSGYDSGDSARQNTTMYSMTYNVADLVTPIPNFNGRSENAQADYSQLLPIVEDAKIGQPGECEIRPFELNLCLVVSGNKTVHQRVHNILEELRRNPTKSRQL